MTVKIVQVTDRYAPSLGGIETHVERLSSGRAGGGQEVEVLTHKLSGTDVGVEQLDGVIVRRFARSIRMTDANFSIRLAAAIRAIDDSDEFRVHGYHDTPAAIDAAFCRISIVFTPHFHGTSDSRFRAVLHRPYRMFGRWIVRRSARVICVGPAERELLRGALGDLGTPTVVIPNGVDAMEIRSALPTILRPGGVHLLAAGRLEDYKHVDKTIMSLIHLDEAYQLHISGAGSQRATLERLVADLGLAHPVNFHGRVGRSEYHGLLQSADLLVTASRHEAPGIAPLEALAAAIKSASRLAGCGSRQ
ncbi:MAG: glycosyltransferase involved in cell wall biosynthesis [Candidatus Aldehydirespiratoraceae bacterium]